MDFVHSEDNWCHKMQRLCSSILSEARGPQQKRRVSETARADREGRVLSKMVDVTNAVLRSELLSVTTSSLREEWARVIWKERSYKDKQPLKLFTTLEYLGLLIWLGSRKEPQKTFREINELIDNDLVFQMLTKPSDIHKNGLEEGPRSFSPVLSL